MIYLRTTDLLLSPPVTHTHTDWQVATDIQFTNIVVSSLGDVVNLTTILFDTPLDSEIKYYARSRVLLSTGYTAWSNIDIFTPDDLGANSTYSILPTQVSIPSLTLLETSGMVSIFNAFINITNVSTSGGSSHETTTYVLETMSGTIVWRSLNDVVDKLRKVIPADVLSPNRAYRLRIIVHTGSMDSSQVVTRTFRTEAQTSGLIMSRISNVRPAVDLVVDLTPGPNVTGVTGLLYSLVNNTLQLEYVATATGVSGNILTIPSAILKTNKKYILRINTNNPLVWDQRIFTTIA